MLLKMRTPVRPSSSSVWRKFALFLAVLSFTWATASAQSNTSFISVVSILMNCGDSQNNNDADGRSWVGDQNSKYAPSTASFPSYSASYPPDPSLPSPIPYMTARVFTSSATYSFPVSSGRYWLRLHFYPSNYGKFQRSDAIFTVTSDSYTLLHNFSTSQTADALTQAYLIREFSVNVTGNRLDVTFSPDRKAGYAFVNGIEVVSMPNLFTDAPLVGTTAPYMIGSSTVLETMFRLNVGGQAIQPLQDSNLSRTWYDDTPYIYGASFGITNDNGSSNLQYTSSDPVYVAPPDVYTTFRSMTPSASVNANFNLTWVFYVDANFTYLVRLHFCEWIYNLPNQRVFNIYINNQMAQEGFDVIGTGASLGNPIYRDYAFYVAPQKGDSSLYVALQPDTTADPPPQFYDAILNGLELFKLNDSAGNLAGPNPVASPPFNYQMPYRCPLTMRGISMQSNSPRTYWGF